MITATVPTTYYNCVYYSTVYLGPSIADPGLSLGGGMRGQNYKKYKNWLNTQCKTRENTAIGGGANAPPLELPLRATTDYNYLDTYS